MTSVFISPEFLPPIPNRRRGVLAFLLRLFEPPVRGHWLDPRGTLIGSPVQIPSASARPAEFGDGRGGYAIAEVAAPLRLELESPAGADRLRVTSGPGRFHSDIPLTQLLRRLPPGRAEERLFPPEGGSFRIDVIGDRFDTAAGFFALAESLYDSWTTQQFPFTETQIKAVFSIRALYWPSDKVRGNFHTPDSAISGRILQGDGSLVRAYQEAHGDPADFALVIINSGRRAGADGALFKNDWQPSWVTVTSEGTEDWRAIALHELAHAFGLADEYDAPPYALPVTHFEPNVSTRPDCAHAPDPWARMCPNASPPYARLFADPRPIGAIKGARYTKDDWYRPHDHCLMRTTTARFCPVCAEYLGRRMLGEVSAHAPLRSR